MLRKYRVSQPWTINIRRRTAEECFADAEAFLAGLPHKAVRQDVVAVIEPGGMEFLLAKGRMDHYEVKINLTADYGVYPKTEIEKLKAIQIKTDTAKEG